MVTRLAVVLSILATTVGVACTADAPLLGSSKEPVLIMVLSRDDFIQTGVGPDSALYALLVTAGTPDSAIYRSVSEAYVRRRADGAIFKWENLGRTGSIHWSDTGLDRRTRGNLRLPWNGVAGTLGRSALTPSDTYDLTIVSEGAVISGSTILPATPTPTLTASSLDIVVVWNRVHGADAYDVLVPPGLGVAGPFANTDTLRRFRYFGDAAFWQDPAWVRVVALDHWLSRYSRDWRTTSAGVVGALGVFGAYARDSVQVPRPALVPPP